MAAPRSNTTARRSAAAATLLTGAALVVALAVLAGCGGDGAGTTTSAEPPGTTTAPAASCSAAGLSTDLPDQDLPAPVAAVRDRIAAAAVACDYAELAAIARENPDGFSFTFGGATDPAAYWRQLETQTDDRPLARLVQILSLPHTRNEIGAYAWPSAYTERPTESDWLALANLYPPAQLEEMRQAGSYLGYRTAISDDGRWLFFVAGD